MQISIRDLDKQKVFSVKWWTHNQRFRNVENMVDGGVGGCGVKKEELIININGVK